MDSTRCRDGSGGLGCGQTQPEDSQGFLLCDLHGGWGCSGPSSQLSEVGEHSQHAHVDCGRVGIRRRCERNTQENRPCNHPCRARGRNLHGSQRASDWADCRVHALNPNIRTRVIINGNKRDEHSVKKDNQRAGMATMKSVRPSMELRRQSGSGKRLGGTDAEKE